MGSFAALSADNAFLIDSVNHHLTCFLRGMNNFTWVQQYTHMDDFLFIRFKKSQIAASCFLQKIECASLFKLF